MDIVMNTGEVVCIDGDARHLTLSCRTGALWVTQPGDPEDHIVSQGEIFVITRKGRIAVTALESSRIHFAESVELHQAALPWQVQSA